MKYQPGETFLETARRAGLRAPFSCEAGSCATCMARLEVGEAKMRVNNALMPDEVEEGWVLTCQGLPTSPTAKVVYELSQPTPLPSGRTPGKGARHAAP